MVNGREYVVMDFGGNTQVRNTQDSPPGDALIAFALPQAGQGAPNEVTASPRQIAQAEPHQEVAAQQSAPSDAHVVTIDMKEISFHPNVFTAKPGEKIAIHLVNQEVAPHEHNIAFELPSGTIVMKSKLKPGEDAYFVFTTPTTPGSYKFWCDVEQHREQGMTGIMTVQAAGSQSNLPNTGASSSPSATFPQTGYSVSGEFLNYWRNNGGLMIFGYPIASEQEVNGQVVQPFERAIVELHPENKAPYNVQLRRLGAEALQQQGIDWQTLPKADPSAAHYFAQTGHAIAPQFWNYWNSQGLKSRRSRRKHARIVSTVWLPDFRAEDGDHRQRRHNAGTMVRAGTVEYHPNNPAQYQVLLGRLGATMWSQMGQ